MFYLTGRTSVVAIIRDVQNAQPTLATAWNVTNTFILALFVGAAAREAWGPRPPAPVVVAVDDAPQQRTIVARPLPVGAVAAVGAATRPVDATPAAVTPAEPTPVEETPADMTPVGASRRGVRA